MYWELKYQQGELRVMLQRAQASSPPPGLRLLAALSLLGWAVVITAGRLLAYTCTRLLVDERCL